MVLASWKDLCLDADDQVAMGRFWASVTGLEVVTSPGKVSLDGPTPGHRIWLNAVDRPHRVKNRLHLDVYAGSVCDLEALGATVVAPAEETGFSWTVMLDPEGGEFCCFVREADVLPAYRLHGIVVDCIDPQAQAAWWGGLLGATPVVDEDHDWHTLGRVTPDEVLTIDFVPVPETREGPNRVHWDLWADPDAVLAAGASLVGQEPGWSVLADPEGNEFCVFRPAGPASG